MKIKNLLLIAAAASLSFTAFADDLSTGEYATLEDGSPAMIGQATLDHLFVRGDYDDMGTLQTYDNVVSFKAGTPQTVWLWLDDDQIYLNEAVQALTPTLLANNAEPYNEITYNSAQFDIYVPQTIEMVEIENEDGDMVAYKQGARMPNSAEFIFSEKGTKVVDGITYRVYTVIISNKQNNGTHFSSQNAKKYRDNGGALKKDDAPLIGLFFQNDNQAEVEGHLNDMIIANQEFGFREAFTADPQWEPNDYRFIYGEGGNNETQRFQYYNRVALYGSTSVVENLGTKTINNVKYYNVAGMESDQPFEGVNIKVTTYNDGTTSTCKVIK
ncbi:MAG: hypothetical protein J5503_06085 [Muribaculaceae bacterium]|nr:hypothetical protein [Muribaculaceae bacterium]